MKPKKINKKLSLNRKTVANLNGSDMGNLHGGGVPIYEHTDPHVCPTQNTYCGTCYTDCGSCIPTCGTCLPNNCPT